MTRYADVCFNLPISGALTYRVPPEMRCELGMRVMAPIKSRRLMGYVINTPPTFDNPGVHLEQIIRVLDDEPLFDERYLNFARWLSRLYFCTLGEALAAMIPGQRSAAKPLLREDPKWEPQIGVVLNPEQRRVVERLTAAATSAAVKDSSRFYLCGVPGSGKSEVFLQFADRLIAAGSSVIYLASEIALTEQLIALIRKRFRREVAQLHSRLTPAQRLREWRRARSGEARLIVGARSAVFAQVPRLGAIIVDEENDGAYKSGSTPRYHARQVAMKRCVDEGAILVLGSATPSLEAWRMMEEGTLQRLTLTQRLPAAAPPRVHIINMNQEKALLSPQLCDTIERVHARGRQSLLFVNRRGFASLFRCRSCAHVIRCSRCEVTMTYHQSGNRMLCHYCGRSTPPPKVACPVCSSLDIGFEVHGIERFEAEVRRQFPALRMARVDTDSARRRGALEETLRLFREGDLDLLVGTQMIAKGLNFPHVQLVAALDADVGLFLPDFRARERTFALLTQVAGRTGRFASDGEVIVQTRSPHNPALAFATPAEHEAFYRTELAERKELRFPPYARLIRLVFRGKVEQRVEEAARLYSAAAEREAVGDITVMGPVECPISRISGNHRHHLMLRGASIDYLHRTARRILDTVTAPRGVHLEVDIDPISVV